MLMTLKVALKNWSKLTRTPKCPRRWDEIGALDADRDTRDRTLAVAGASPANVGT